MVPRIAVPRGRRGLTGACRGVAQAQDEQTELRAGLRAVLAGRKPTLPPRAAELEGAEGFGHEMRDPAFLLSSYEADTSREAGFRPGFVRGGLEEVEDEDEEMEDVDDGYGNPADGREWAEQEEEDGRRGTTSSSGGQRAAAGEE